MLECEMDFFNRKKTKEYENMTEKLQTIIEDGSSDSAIKKAAQILRAGGLVAFPTETVYGLGGDALSPDAAAKIYAAKGRPSDNPLIVHIADTDALPILAGEVPEKARMLAEAFWPGPLTIILPKKDIVPDATTGGLPTVAIRMPSHPAALALIRESGLYIAAPSANASGRPSPTLASHVAEDLSGRIDMILDGGPVGIGIESTIVDLTGDTPTICRPGFITKEMLTSIIGNVEIDPALIHPSKDARPKAPGMRYTHYAPKGELTVVEASDPESASDPEEAKRVADTISRLALEKENEGFRVAILAAEENSMYYSRGHVITVGSVRSGVTVAARLYAALRECDEAGAEVIYSESFDGTDISDAIMNRLLKAAGQRVLHTS